MPSQVLGQLRSRLGCVRINGKQLASAACRVRDWKIHKANQMHLQLTGKLLPDIRALNEPRLSLFESDDALHLVLLHLLFSSRLMKRSCVLELLTNKVNSVGHTLSAKDLAAVERLTTGKSINVQPYVKGCPRFAVWHTFVCAYERAANYEALLATPKIMAHVTGEL